MSIKSLLLIRYSNFNKLPRFINHIMIHICCFFITKKTLSFSLYNRKVAALTLNALLLLVIIRS